MSEPTEPPSPRRLRRAREEGRVPSSRDAAFASAAVGTLIGLTLTGPALVRAWQQGFAGVLEAAARPGAPLVDGALEATGRSLLLPLLLPTLLAAGLTLLTGLVINGFLFSPRTALPSLDRIDPSAYLSRLLRPGTWVEPVVRLLLACAPLVAGAVVVEALVPEAMGLARSVPRGAFDVWVEALRRVAARGVAVLVVLAVLDVLYRRWSYLRGLRMSRAELQREARESEGDPHTRQARERARRELLEAAAIDQVKRAAFVVTNPTHFAVALAWDEEAMDAPELLAKGAGEFARQIVEEAHRHGVPVLRAAPLARSLHELEVGQAVPESLYEAVAAVVNYLAQGGDPDAFDP